MIDRLESLVTLAQQQAPQPEEQASIFAQLATEILRSRKLGRAPRGQPLSGVHLEIYERVQQQVLTDLPAAIAAFSPGRIDPREWAIGLQRQAFRTILDDAQLKRLALEAQRHPPQSEGRHHTLTQLVEAIRLSGRLARPRQASFSAQFYELLYEEAVNRTLTYICRCIDNYDPERGQDKKFMSWVNFRLDKTMIDCRREFSDQNVTAVPDLNTLDALAQPEAETEPSVAELVKECITVDANRHFQTTHIRDRPDASFRAIALARLAEQSWEEISRQFNIKIPTLSSFYQRCCEKFAPQFQEFL